MKENIYYPRTLIISRNALSQGGSNGKVLGQLFSCWQGDKLAQFYSYNELPDNPKCTRYWRVTDRDALHSFLSLRKYGGKINNKELKEPIQLPGQVANPVKKSPLTLLLRDLVWNSNRWRSQAFWKWVEEFNPEIIVLMAGASSFTHKIALDVARKFAIPLVVFNTENYFFKNYNYLERKGWRMFYPLYKWQSDRMFRRLMKYSSHEVYNNNYLERLYRNGFGKEGSVIFQATSLTPLPKKRNRDKLVFSYAGNLGLERHKALIEIGKVLQKISREYVLDVYGRVTSSDVKAELENAIGIRFHGLVPYNQVLKVIEDSDFMIHAESFDPFWVKDLCSAFSTKISDILASGRCLILYAAESLACVEYVIQNQCGCVITDPMKLEEHLRNLLNDDKLQQKYIQNGISVSQRDMNNKINSERFLMLINNVLGK